MSSTSLTVRGSLLSPRWVWHRLTAWMGRAQAEPVHLGADFAMSQEVMPTYDLRDAMSAYAAFPWVYAAMVRRSGDLAGLPLLVKRGRGVPVTVSEHPFYDLIDSPGFGMTGRQLRRQLAIDLPIAGNAFVVRVGEERTLVQLQRLHPHRVLIEPDTTTGVAEYVYRGAGRETRIEPGCVHHIHRPSWEDDPSGAFGTGAILPLHDELTTTRLARKRTAEIAKRGRPDAILAPGDDEQWPEDVRKAIKHRLEAMLSGGGALVLGQKMDLKLPSWSPRDLEFEKVITMAREAVLAVTGVPPHMVGLPSANYALAEAQERVYYQMLQSEAADFEDVLWNPLVKRLYGPRYSVEHDFSGIEALAAARGARIERAVKLIGAGADAQAVMRLEGLPEDLFPEVEQAIEELPAMTDEEKTARDRAWAQWSHHAAK